MTQKEYREEKKAIETLKEVASDDFDTLGDDISPKMAQNILNVIDKLKDNLYEEQEQNEYLKDKVGKQQKEIKELKSKYKDLFFQNFELWEKSIFPKQTIEKDYISKDKIRDYFAQAIAFKRRLIRENEEISDYNRGKFDTIEDLFERLEDNKWN